MLDMNENKRNIFLSSAIDNDSAKDIVQTILNINEYDLSQETVLANYQRVPILLFINSSGGSVYDGLAIVDAIKQSVTPIITICLGLCASMGMWIWLASDYRLIGKHSTLMFHGISTSIEQQKLPDVRGQLEETIRLENLFSSEVTSISKICRDKVRESLENKSDWYIPADEAIKLKLATDYYDLFQDDKPKVNKETKKANIFKSLFAKKETSNSEESNDSRDSEEAERCGE